MGGDYIHSVDPLWFHFGFISMRYYSALFIASIIFGYLLWRWQMRRAGYTTAAVRSILLLGVPVLFVSARLAHCLIYQPGYFLSHPLQMLLLWKGGLASHGALIAMPAVLFVLARRHKLPVLDVMDRFTFSSSLGACLVRIGNFFNSEIVGRETELPIGIRFIRYDGASKLRHPTQLYEAAIGAAVLATLVIVDKLLGKEQRPRGVLTGLFLSLYFSARFLVEFTKEYQCMSSDTPLTMGQILSVPPILVGVVVLVWRVKASHKSA